MTPEYIKSLEDENEKLRKLLDAAVLKADCYDLIMKNVSSTARPKETGTVYYSNVSFGQISLLCLIDHTVDINTPAYVKIRDDFIEDDKASAGSKRKKIK